MSQKSIVFINPAYHYSFVYRDELRRIGWKADIYVGASYPEKLLYSDQDIIRPPSWRHVPLIGRYLDALRGFFLYMKLCWQYKYHMYYGGVDYFDFFDERLGLTKLFGDSFRLHLWLAKVFRRKIIQLPSGCLEEETRSNFSKLDGGNVCNNCGWATGKCNDRLNVSRFNLLRRYADMVVGMGSIDSTQYRATHFKYKAIDLELWRPDLSVPEEFRLPPTRNIRIMHSFFSDNREHGGKNIKGSPFVVQAIERLKEEGHNVEYLYITDVRSRDMRYYQAQADIIVDQLIYGWWGSTLVEAAALGKPVVCYLRPSWKSFFLKTFPEYVDLPIVEATTADIYDVLKKLVTDHGYCEEMGRRARQFAEQHFNAAENARELAGLLQAL